MNNKTSLLNMRHMGIAILILVALMSHSVVASAENCASKYPENYQYEPAIHDIFQNACYSCPKGAQRTAEGIFSKRACVEPEQTVYKRARDHGASGFLGANCKGKIYDVGKGRCYTCPSGLKRTVFPVTSGQACVKTERAKFGKASHRGQAPSANPEVERLAKNRIKQYANSFVHKLEQLASLTQDPDFLRRLQRGDSSIERNIRKILVASSASDPVFKALSIGGTGDANLAIINAGVDTGISIDIRPVQSPRPVYWYGAASYGLKLGAGASAGPTLGLWVDENNAIVGDFHGYSFDLFALLKGAKILKQFQQNTGRSIGLEVAAWFNEAQHNRFLGITITPSIGKGISVTPAGYSRGHTAQVTQ